MMRSRAGALLEQSPDGIVVHDGEHIVAVNAAMLRLAGAARPEQVVGKPVAALFERPYLKDVERQLVMGESVRGARFVRERLYGLDGAVHEVDVHAQLFLDGTDPAVFLVLHDVQEQIAAERFAQDQLLGERLLGGRVDARQVAGGVAHVLNNRLQIILGFASLVGDEPLTRDQQRDLDQIVSAARQGADITRQLLQSAGGAPCNREVVALDVLARRLFPELEVSYPEGAEPLQLITEAAPLVHVDPVHVQYMLTYLVANARRATRARGHVTITVETKVLRRTQLASQGHRIARGCYGSISVHDTGSGLSADARARMFEPFFSTAAIGEGNGLGLPAVQGMLRQNGGFLTFVSSPDQGTTFTLLFPEAEAAPSDAAAVRGERADSVESILVVDADASMRAVTARGLERVGYRVLQAHSAGQGLEVIEHLGCPTLLVISEEVERGDARLLARLRAHCAMVPVLVLGTSRERSATVAPLVPALAGVVVRLTAPFSEYLLASHVQAMLGDGDRA